MDECLKTYTDEKKPDVKECHQDNTARLKFQVQ